MLLQCFKFIWMNISSQPYLNWNHSHLYTCSILSLGWFVRFTPNIPPPNFIPLQKLPWNLTSIPRMTAHHFWDEAMFKFKIWKGGFRSWKILSFSRGPLWHSLNSHLPSGKTQLVQELHQLQKLLVEPWAENEEDGPRDFFEKTSRGTSPSTHMNLQFQGSKKANVPPFELFSPICLTKTWLVSFSLSLNRYLRKRFLVSFSPILNNSSSNFIFKIRLSLA